MSDRAAAPERSYRSWYSRQAAYLAGIGWARFFGLSLLGLFCFALLLEGLASLVGLISQESAPDLQDGLMPLGIAYVMLAAILKLVGSDLQKAQARAGVAETEASAQALQRQVLEARLQVLQAQIEPHFLFNTLASVEHLVETDPGRAGRMLRHLIDWLRVAMPRMREQDSSIGREVDLVRAFLEIMQLRMEERLRFDIDLPEGLRSARFPPMMLQTLVENAIRHGLEPKIEGGCISVAVRVVDGLLEAKVVDTGAGLRAGSTPGAGIGLANLRERLLSLHGDSASLNLAQNPGSGTVATIRLPYGAALA